MSLFHGDACDIRLGVGSGSVMRSEVREVDLRGRVLLKIYFLGLG